MKKITLFTLPLLFVACSKSTAPLMQAPPEKYEKIVLAAGESKQIEKPKVDILFVIDNSGSMKPHQEKLQKNTDAFADAFFKVSRIDYRIGVVPVYDSKYLNDKKVYSNGPRKMNALGELVALKNKEGQIIEGVPYITPETQNAKEVLKSTVGIGVQWGPEAEESFSPVLAITSNETLNVEKNAGFYREDAHLFLIFLTDADDATIDYSPEEFYNELVALKSDKGTQNGREKIHIAAAISPSELKSAPCADNGTGAVERIPELLSFSRGKKADLCSSRFGLEFAEYAQSVANSIGRQSVKLAFTPDVTYQISVGKPNSTKEERVVVPRENYTFLPETNEFLLPANLGVSMGEESVIFVDAIPVQLRNHKNGRLLSL